MDPVATYSRIEIQAQDVMVDDVWVIPGLEEGYHVRESYPDKGKPFWILEGRDRGRKVQSVHNPRTILEIMRKSDDPGEFVDEHGEVHPGEEMLSDLETIEDEECDEDAVIPLTLADIEEIEESDDD